MLRRVSEAPDASIIRAMSTPVNFNRPHYATSQKTAIFTCMFAITFYCHPYHRKVETSGREIYKNMRSSSFLFCTTYYQLFSSVKYVTSDLRSRLTNERNVAAPDFTFCWCSEVRQLSRLLRRDVISGRTQSS
jgi:hypothetical protein